MSAVVSAYESCSLCGGHGVRMTGSGDIGDCYKCDGSGQQRARDDRGRFCVKPLSSGVTHV